MDFVSIKTQRLGDKMCSDHSVGQVRLNVSLQTGAMNNFIISSTKDFFCTNARMAKYMLSKASAEVGNQLRGPNKQC